MHARPVASLPVQISKPPNTSAKYQLVAKAWLVPPLPLSSVA